jgi:integrase
MALELIWPGQRKGNPYFVVRGAINGRRIEVSTKTRDETAARLFKNDLETKLLKNQSPKAGDDISFRRAAELYFAFKNLPAADQRRIQRTVDYMDPTGKILVGQVVHANLVAAANVLYAGRKNETKNRWVIKPGSAILHYAADNKWCAWERIKKFEEGPIETRASNDATFDIIMAALRDDEQSATSEFQRRLARRKQLFILWLFRHWNRISEVLRVTWEHIDLNERTYRLYNRKANRYSNKPLDEEIFEWLANEPDKFGRLFSWADKGSVYKWLRPLVRRLKVDFTAHMARHYGGKLLNRTGSGLKTIMGALDHKDAKSSLRYQDADREIIREAMARSAEIRRRPIERSDGGE